MLTAGCMLRCAFQLPKRQRALLASGAWQKRAIPPQIEIEAAEEPNATSKRIDVNDIAPTLKSHHVKAFRKAKI